VINKEIGRKIRQLRKGLGLSQSELAEKIGVSFQQVQKYEKGLTRVSVMRLQQISEVFGVNIASFFEKGKNLPKVSDFTLEYTSGEKLRETFLPLNKEEITLIKLFRKTKNRKIREGIIKQLRGVIELESRKSESSLPQNIE
jgi:transcriptional regulator with XRE-family HTH domain